MVVLPLYLNPCFQVTHSLEVQYFPVGWKELWILPRINQIFSSVNYSTVNRALIRISWLIKTLEKLF